MQVVTNSILTHYELSGTGPVLLLLHGWGDRLETFDAITSMLQKTFTVVRLDLPGFGGTEAPQETWGLEQYAGFVSDFMTKLDIPKPRALIGHSNGGAVAITGLAHKTLQADRLILLASAGIRNRHGLRKNFIKLVAKVGKAATFWLPRHHKQALQRKLYGTIGSDMLVAPHLKETFKRTVSQDIQQQAEQLRLPTLLIYGDKDAATPVHEIGVPLHEVIHNSKLHILHDADHFVHQAAAQEVSQQIKEFVA